MANGQGGVYWPTAVLEARMRRAALRGIVRGVEHIRNDILDRILTGTKSGRAYRRGGVVHIASAPGEAPASDTGHLVGSITTDFDLPGMAGYVKIGASYAKYLEYGTQKMEPRPFVRPAAKAGRQAVVDYVAEEIRAEFPATHGGFSVL